MTQLKALDFLKYEELTLRRKWGSGSMTYVDAERHKMIKEAIAELKVLQEPKGCNACKHLMDNVCNHPGIPEFYTPQYINYSGCGLHHQLTPQQPESKDDPAI